MDKSLALRPAAMVCILVFTAPAQPPSGDALDLAGEIAQLKSRVAAQQQQIDELRRLLETQNKLLAKVVPESPVVPAPKPVSPPPSTTPSSTEAAAAKPPLSVEIGNVSFTPSGFLDFSQVWRSSTVSSGLPTNFAAVPFSDTVEGNRSQTLSTAAHSRLGMRLNTSILGFNVLGMVETDFLGFQPGNIATTTNAYGLRLRLAFVDLRKGRWELLGGQNWSLLTPSRNGIPTLPNGLMLMQDLDPNNQSGLVWARTPQARAVYRPRDDLALGVSFEAGDTYVGGSGGATPITLPRSLQPDYFNQLNFGDAATGVPNFHSDLIGKIAWDPAAGGHHLHFELGGLMNRFEFYNPLIKQRFRSTGGGAAVNASVQLTRSLTLFSNNFYSHGGGRFIFGEAPALIVRENGQPSLIHSMATLNGLEMQPVPNWRFWAYYGGTYVSRNVTFDSSTGQFVGYGYTGSPDGQNRSIQEVTGGFTRVFWQNPNYGTLQFSGQFSWVQRNPWFVAPNRPSAADLKMMYLGLRYILPGAPAPAK